MKDDRVEKLGLLHRALQQQGQQSLPQQVCPPGEQCELYCNTIEKNIKTLECIDISRSKPLKRTSNHSV
jgi:hypothetical protein